ncbi:MAG: hypothetical protein IPJ65_35640 [Archangiaceae bacterium]|nr:hypothetical protein [Archangiaceae bacterium]
MKTKRLVLFVSIFLAALAHADEGRRLGVFASTGVLANTGGLGGALNAGLRFAPARHLALGFDLGYGLIDTVTSAQDRWWLVPTVAAVLPLEGLRLELGAGLGLATASGYRSWAGFRAAPFDPAWAFQLVPAARAHFTVSVPLNARVEVFGRAELGSLLLGGNRIGLRDGRNPEPQLHDTTWAQLALGVQLGVL